MHQKLAQQIECELQQLSKRLGVKYTPPVSDEEGLVESRMVEDFSTSSNQPPCASTLVSNHDEDELRLQQASDWIQQERFNIQEAFTNQTKKVQADFQSFLERLDQEFEVECQRISSSYSEVNHAADDRRLKVSSSLGSGQKQQSVLDRGNQQFEKQFKGNAKRPMLVHTAPVMDPSGASRDSSLLKSLHFRNSNSSSNRKSDVSKMQQQLDNLQAQTQAMKEVRKSREGYFMTN